MKMTKKNLLKSLSVAAIISSLLFTGCKFLNTPVKNYFKEYTETAAVMLHNLPVENLPVDKDGYICIPSDSDFTIECLLRNPQLYTLEFGYKFSDPDIQKKADLYGTGAVELVQLSDFTTLNLTFPSDYLRTTEMGGDLTGNITLFEPKSQRNFTTYELKYRSNSIPEPVRSLTVLQDNINNLYVLSFIMPDMTGIHNDISKITICGKEFAIDNTGATQDSIGFAAGSEGYESFTTTVPEDADWGLGASDTHQTSRGQRTVYYRTSIPFQNDDYKFDVYLEDAKGLSVGSEVTQHSKKLSPVPELEESMIEADEDGYASFTLKAPDTETEGTAVDTSDISVYYKLYRYNKSTDTVGELIKEGYGVSQVNVFVGNGNWYYETWAHKKNYIDSDTTYSNVAAQGFVYVDAGFAGEVSDGGLNTPYKNVEDAIASSENAGFTESKIILLSDVSLAGPVVLDNMSLVMKATDKKTVTGVITLENENFLQIIGNLRFKAPAGSDYSVVMNSDTLVKTYNITAGDSDDLIASIEYLGPCITGTKLIQSVDKVMTSAIADRFNINYKGYFIGPDETGEYGVIKVSGVAVSVSTPKESYIIKINGLTEIEGSYGIYEFVSGEPVTVESIKEDIEETAGVIAQTYEPVSIKLRSASTVVAEAAGNVLVIPDGLKSGRYWLEVSFVDSGITVTGTYTVLITAAE